MQKASTKQKLTMHIKTKKTTQKDSQGKTQIIKQHIQQMYKKTKPQTKTKHNKPRHIEKTQNTLTETIHNNTQSQNTNSNNK